MENSNNNTINSNNNNHNNSTIHFIIDHQSEEEITASTLDWTTIIIITLFPIIFVTPFVNLIIKKTMVNSVSIPMLLNFMLKNIYTKKYFANCSKYITNTSLQIWYCLVLHYFGIKWSLIEFLQRHHTFDINSTPNRRGHVAVITGGARGIGVHVVKKLLRCEMHVIIGCRNTASGLKVVNEIRKEGFTKGNVEVLELDLMSLNSVRSFANEILLKNIPIHVLINNAGIMFVPYQLTKDGFESHFQVNYLSHFLLTNLLLPRMISTAKNTNLTGKIVNVSSCAHYGGKYLADDLTMRYRDFYSPYLGYMVSKFLQVVSSNGLNKKLAIAKANVIVNSVHPGIVQTELYQHLWWVNAFRTLVQFFFKSPEQGADPIVYAALSPEIEENGGLYIANSMKYQPNSDTLDSNIQNLVLTMSEKLANTKFLMDTTSSIDNNN